MDEEDFDKWGVFAVLADLALIVMPIINIVWLSESPCASKTTIGSAASAINLVVLICSIIKLFASIITYIILVRKSDAAFRVIAASKEDSEYSSAAEQKPVAPNSPKKVTPRKKEEEEYRPEQNEEDLDGIE